MILSAFKGFVISLSMFTVIPVPNLWTSKAREQGALKFVVPFLPIVGAIIGIMWYNFTRLTLIVNERLSLNGTLAAAFIFLFPQAVSGFIHMDGFMDTADAVFSGAPIEKKREILKDSRVGAFGAIALSVYLLLGFAAATELTDVSLADGAAFLFVPAVARGVSASWLLNARAVSETGLGAALKEGAGFWQKSLPAIACVLFITLSVLDANPMAALPLIVTAAAGIFAMAFAVRQLGVVSGDLCGFSVTIGELCGFIAFCAVKGGGM